MKAATVIAQYQDADLETMEKWKRVKKEKTSCDRQDDYKQARREKQQERELYAAVMEREQRRYSRFM